MGGCLIIYGGLWTENDKRDEFKSKAFNFSQLALVFNVGSFFNPWSMQIDWNILAVETLSSEKLNSHSYHGVKLEWSESKRITQEANIIISINKILLGCVRKPGQPKKCSNTKYNEARTMLVMVWGMCCIRYDGDRCPKCEYFNMLISGDPDHYQTLI